MKKEQLALLSAIGLVAFLGCDQIDDALPSSNDEDANAAADSLVLSDQESALLIAATDGVDLSMEPSAIAQAVADRAGETFTPSDCVMSENVSGTVTWTFNDCSGPYGLVSLNGIANAVYGVEGLDSISVILTATDLQVNDATMTINAQAVYSVDAETGGQQVALNTTGVGTSEGGVVISRVGTYVADWDGEVGEGCFALDGQWNSTIGAAESTWITTIANYERCGASCPTSGELVFTGVEDPELGEEEPTASDGVVVTIQFDGDDSARFVTSRGRAGNIPLTCE